MGLLNPFSSDTNERNCTAHHYEDYSLRWREVSIIDETTIPDGDGGYNLGLEIHVPRSSQCEHKGCAKKDYRPPKKKVVPMNALCDMDRSGFENAGDISELIEEYREDS